MNKSTLSISEFLKTYEEKIKIKIIDDEEKRRLKGNGLISSENIAKLKR